MLRTILVVAVSLSNSGTNDVALTDVNALDLGTVTVGQNLTVTTGGALTDSGAITVGSLATIVSTGQAVTLGDSTTANFGSIDFAGSAVSIKEGSSMEVAASEATGVLSLEAAGAITQTGAIDADLASSFTAGANAITLTNASNDFSGAVSLSNSGTNDVALTDANALDLGTVTVGQNLSVIASGVISDSGVVTVAGTSSLDNAGGTNAAILLDSANTFTGNVSFTTDTGSDVTITDNSDFGIQSGLNVNNLSITSTGSVTDLGDIDIDGTLTVSAAGQTIDLSGTGNDLSGAVTLTGAAVTLQDTTATAIAGITATGDLSVTSGGAISASGALAITGDAIFNNSAGSDDSVILDNAANSFSGSVTFTIDTGSAVTVVDTTALDLQALTAASLSITASGDVTDSGTLAISGATTINAGTANITLNETASTFGALALTGANVAVTENAAMELAASTINGTASFDSTNNAITDSGTLTIAGATTIDAGTGNITLDEASSTFGALALTGENVAVTENAAMELAASTISGTATFNSNNNEITDSGTLAITGTTTVNAGTANISLDQTLSSFGTLALTGANVSVVDSGATDLGTSTVSGNLSITSGGAVTDSGALAVTGSISISAPDQSVSLTETASTYGDFAVNAKDIFVMESGAFTSTSLTAETVQVVASEGVSIVSTGDGLQVAAQSATGDINVVNTGGLVISELDNVQGVKLTSTDASGKISLVAKSPLTINAEVNAMQGEVLLVAAGSDTADDVTINSNILGKSVDVFAGDSIEVTDGATIVSPTFELNVGTNYDITTATTTSGSTTASIALSSIAGLEKISIPSVGVITGKGRVTQFSSKGIIFMDDYLNALNPALEETVNLNEIGVTGSIEGEIYNFVDADNNGEIEIEKKK